MVIPCVLLAVEAVEDELCLWSTIVSVVLYYRTASGVSIDMDLLYIKPGEVC